MQLNKERRNGKRNKYDGLFRPAKSLIAMVLVIGLVSGVFFRWLYEDRPWVTAIETVATEGSASTGSQNATEVEVPVPTSTSGLTANQILQRITDAVAGNLTTNESYLAIPTAQLDGLSFEEYQRYISLVDLAIDAEPTSFSPMTTSERDRQIARIVQVDPDYRELAEGSSYHWIEGMGADREMQNVAIALQTNANGLVYMDRNWVKHSIDLYDYSQTYFGTINQQNAEILSKMINSVSSTSEVKLAKAQSIINYYSYFRIVNQGLKLESFDIAHIRYTVTSQFSNYGDDDSIATSTDPFGGELPNRSQLFEAIEDGFLDSRITRTLLINQTSAGAYRIIDPIPEMTTANDFTLEMPDGTPLNLETEVNSEDLNLVFGTPILVTSYEAVSNGYSGVTSDRSVLAPTPIETEAPEDEEDPNYMFIRYDGVELLLKNHEEFEDGSASGTLVGITFTKPLLTTVRGLSPLSKLDDLLLTYNFIDQTNFILKNKNLGYYISFPRMDTDSSSGQRLGAIRIGRIADLDYDLYEDGETFGTGDDLIKDNEPEDDETRDRENDRDSGLAPQIKSYAYDR